MSDFNSEDLSKLSEELLRLTQNGVNPLGASASASTGHLNNFSDALKKAEILKDFVKNVSAVNDALGDLADAADDAIQKSDKATDEEKESRKKAVKKFRDDLLNAGGTALSAMSDASHGTGKYTRSLEQVGLSAEKLGKEYGKMGEALGWGADKMMAWAAASLKQNDALMGTYQSLSKFGQIDTSDLKDVMGDIHDAGFRVQTAANYVAIVTKTSQDLALLGTSAGNSRKILNDVFDGTLNDDVKESLMRFGMTTEEMFEKSAGYLSTIAMSTKLQKTDIAALHEQTVNYLKNYSELSELTGKNRDEMAAGRKKQQEDVAFQLYLEELRGQGKEGQEKAARAEEMVSAQGSEKDMVGAMQYLRSGGNIIGKETSGMMNKFGETQMRSMKNYVDTNQDLSTEQGRQKEQSDFYDTLQGLAKAQRRTMDTFGGTMRMSSNAEGFRNSFNIDPGSFKFMRLHEDRGSKEYQEMVARRDAKPTKSDRIGLGAKQEGNERRIQQAQDNAVYAMGDIAVPAVTSFTTAVDAATDALTTMTDYIGATDNWNKPFKKLDTLADVSETLAKEQRKQVDLQEEINGLDKEAVAYQEKIDELRQDAEKGGIRGWMAKQKLGMNQSDQATVLEKRARAQKQLEQSNQQSNRATTAGTRIQSGTDVLSGLNLRGYGDVHVPGKYVDPTLIEAAHKAQSQIPGFNYFSSFNDQFHQDKNSNHKTGRAFDMVLTNPPSEEDGKKIVRMLEGMGLKAIDEYHNPSGNSTAGHIHAELKAKTGGVFDGPQSGYKVELHGKEAIVPMNSAQGFKQLGNLSEQDPSKGVTKHALSRGMADSGMTTHGSPLVENLMRQLMSVLASKMDDLIYEMQQSNATQGKIAKAAKK